MNLNGKKIDLPQLKAEADAAGVVVGDLGTAGDELVTYDEDGHTIDVPAEMAPVLAAHVPPAPETPVASILLLMLADVSDVDETKPILEAMLYLLGGS